MSDPFRAYRFESFRGLGNVSTSSSRSSRSRRRSSSSSPLRSRYAATSLSRRRLSTADLPETLEMEFLGESSQQQDEPELPVFDEPEPPIAKPPPVLKQQPGFDPREHLYQDIAIGEGGFSNSMEEDLVKMADLGLIIDGSENGKLGNGFFGVVYKGVYGKGIKDLRDKEGKLLRNVEEGRPFAAKFVDFKTEEEQYRGGGMAGATQEKRECYQMEKLIMTVCNHPNIVPIRMAVNMGEPRVFQNRLKGTTFQQHDRVYLIMDFAELGCLIEYMHKNVNKMSPSDRIKMVRDLFWGMKYLHDTGIVHGDIHAGNVLVFLENNEVVAKWADFGLADVTVSGEFVYRVNMGGRMNRQIKLDCNKMGIVLKNIWSGRQRDQESQEEQWLCDQHIKMVQAITTATNLDIVLGQFREIMDYDERLV